VATNVTNFEHVTNTAIGTATGTLNDATVGSFVATVGLVNLDGTGNTTYLAASDIALNFTTPSTTLTKAGFEARLQYNLTGTGGADVITTGVLADTITGGDGADSITAGLGADIIRWAATTTAGIAAEAGTNAAAATTFAAGTAGDKVVGFVSGTDKLYFSQTLVNPSGNDTDTLRSIVKTGTISAGDRFVHITNTVVGDGINAGAGAVTIIDALTTTGVAIGDSVIIAMDNDTSIYLWYLKQVSASGTVAAQDLTLIGEITGITTVANGDFVSF
jgi:hypothetical protein